MHLDYTYANTYNYVYIYIFSANRKYYWNLYSIVWITAIIIAYQVKLKMQATWCESRSGMLTVSGIAAVFPLSGALLGAGATGTCH